MGDCEATESWGNALRRADHRGKKDGARRLRPAPPRADGACCSCSKARSVVILGSGCWLAQRKHSRASGSNAVDEVVL